MYHRYSDLIVTVNGLLHLGVSHYLWLYLLSIFLIGYKKSRATSVAVCTNELSISSNKEPKKLLRRTGLRFSGIGDTGKPSLLPL